MMQVRWTGGWVFPLKPVLFPMAWMAWMALYRKSMQIGWTIGDSKKYHTPCIIFLTLKTACLCHGHTLTEMLGPSQVFPWLLCPLQKIITKEEPSCKPCHLVFWQFGVWYTATHFSPGKPGGTIYSRKLPKQKSYLQNQVETLPKAFQHSCQICRDPLRGSFHSFVKCSIAATTSQVLWSFSLQPVSSILTSQKGYLCALQCWVGCLQALGLVQQWGCSPQHPDKPGRPLSKRTYW